MQTPISFHRGVEPSAAATARVAKPQDPKPPFPYRSEAVAYDNVAEHVRLAGTLTLPPGPGPHPAVLLITGSGPQDRDETILGHKPFWVIADALSRRGVAVLRVDDRGVGESGGSFAGATTADFATDVAAGVAFLKSRPDVDRHHIGLLGHSEGGVIAPMVANRDRDIAFLVLLAGSSVPGRDILLYQERNAYELAHAPSAVVEAGMADRRKIFEILASAAPQAQASAAISAVFAAEGAPASAAQQAAEQFTNPWTRWFANYDPAPTLRQLRLPVLALYGERDTQVPPAINLAPMRAALKADPRANVVELPGLNHLFQTAVTGQLDEYAKSQETISPKALDLICDWVVARAKH